MYFDIGTGNPPVKIQSRPATRHLVSLLGTVGALLCLAGSLAVWYVASRIDRAQERVFKRVDQSLEGIDRRLVETQNLAAQSKITVEEIRQRTQDWTKKETSERLATKFGVEAKVQQLASGLHQAELILERSQVLFAYRIEAPAIWPHLLIGGIPFISIPTLLGVISIGAMWWMLVGVACYVIGLVFFVNDERVRHFHAVWHVFVIAGSMCHFMGIYMFVVRV